MGGSSTYRSSNTSSATTGSDVPGTSVEVGSIVVSTVNLGRGVRKGRAAVVVVDDQGTPVAGATVTERTVLTMCSVTVRRSSCLGAKPLFQGHVHKKLPDDDLSTACEEAKHLSGRFKRDDLAMWWPSRESALVLQKRQEVKFRNGSDSIAL